MEPISLDQRSKKGWIIVHSCALCQKTCSNKAAPDDDLSVLLEEGGK